MKSISNNFKRLVSFQSHSIIKQAGCFAISPCEMYTAVSNLEAPSADLHLTHSRLEFSLTVVVWA